MNPVAPLRVGLAGAGRFGALHASVLAGLPEVCLAAIADPCPERLQALADRHGVPQRFASAEQLLADGDLEAFVLVTPDDQHAAQARRALATGKPVFVEKPLAGSSAEARSLQQAALASGSLLQTGLILRYELQHAQLQQELAAGRFGELVSIRVKRNCSAAWFAAIADRAHTVFETLIHDIDLMLWFSGSHATRVMALERRFGPHRSPEGCYALIAFANGCIGLAETSWFVPEQAPANVGAGSWQGTIDAELEVVGTRQTAQLRLLQGPLQIWGEPRQRCPEAQLWPMHQGVVRGALQAELADFVACARTGRPSATARLDQAIEGLRIAEAIVASARCGEAITLTA